MELTDVEVQTLIAFIHEFNVDASDVYQKNQFDVLVKLGYFQKETKWTKPIVIFP